MGGMGLFDHLKEAIILDYSHSSRMRSIFESLIDEYRRGAQLLQASTHPVDTIASKVGFASRSHFSRAFQQQFGSSPVEFRKQHA